MFLGGAGYPWNFLSCQNKLVWAGGGTFALAGTGIGAGVGAGGDLVVASVAEVSMEGRWSTPAPARPQSQL